MKMTKQHFEALADLCTEVIDIVQPYTGLGEKYAIVDEFADFCADSNPNFDTMRFRAWVDEKLEKKGHIVSGTARMTGGIMD